jgi:polysaccharide biosynthesis protein PslF
VLSRCDVAIIQHEYGIFGGTDGDEVIDLLRALEVPAIVVLHTVPLLPTPNQHAVLVAIADLADRVIVMSEAANDRLLASYPVDASKVVTIPHGATPPTAQFDRSDIVDAPPQLLTWGLLGPGKGIEHAIDALALLSDIHPHYTVAGVTHPKVHARRGDEYRNSLVAQSRRLGVADTVTFDDRYRNVIQLTQFVASASVVVLPYDSRDQVTSGVLVDAIAAGRPVIATAFPHAVELLGTGAGIVVPHQDPVALADAIRLAITDTDELSSMAAEARRIAPSLSWNAVADRYVGITAELLPDDDLVGAGGSVTR